MLHPRNPNLLSVDHIAVALFNSGGFDFGGIGSGGGLGDAHGLQTPLTRGNFGQVQIFLRLGAMPQQGAHVVHLPVACARVASIAVDFFHDHRGFRQTQARATVFGRNQRRQPTRLGERIYKRLRVSTIMVHLAVVFIRKLGAQIFNGVADVLVGVLSIHSSFQELKKGFKRLHVLGADHQLIPVQGGHHGQQSGTALVADFVGCPLVFKQSFAHTIQKFIYGCS